MSWAEAEFHDIDLGDKRRDRRAIRLVERLAERPTASIPGACNGWGETQAVPLTHSVFWGPMAIAIMRGLTVATLRTIFFVPARYAAWFRIVPEGAARAGQAVQGPVGQS